MADGQEVVVTGIGALLAGCDHRKVLWRQLTSMESQLRMCADPADPNRIRPMGRLIDFDARRYLGSYPERYYARTPRDTRILLSAAALACVDARLRFPVAEPTRAGFFDGTARGSFAHWYEKSSAAVPGRQDFVAATPGQGAGIAAALMRIRGPVYTFVGTCSSSAVAIGHAYRELCVGDIDVALAGGHDAALIEPMYHMYHDARLLSDEVAIDPYLHSRGNALGEGAIMFVLETRRHAQARGAKILARLNGFAYGNNGTHPTHVDPVAERAQRVVEDLLCHAEVSVAQIGFVVGHGNGMPSSDQAELFLLRKLFGSDTSLPVIATKPIYGHTLGAAAALNLAAAVLMLYHGQTVPGVSIAGNPVRIPAQRLPESVSGLALSFGIGGHNTALLASTS